MIYEISGSPSVSALFGKWDETILWSCLQGVMGNLFATGKHHPASAMAMLGDFAFFAGKTDEELIAFRPEWRQKDFMILIPQNESWKNAILKHYGNRAKSVPRYATKKESGIFHPEKLKQIVSLLPAGYELCRIDEPLYHMCKANSWSMDLVSQFTDYEAYRRLGLGAAVKKGNRLISGASSYSRYRDGIEIEIDTCREYRRNGFARICAAKLILECLKRNWYPAWDAQNKASLSLAEQLGYHYSHTYEAIELWGY